jgi:hypothetical protein
MAFTIAAPNPVKVLSTAWFTFSTSVGNLTTTPKYSGLVSLCGPAGAEMTCAILGTADAGAEE